jgi:hypothetical protein
MGLDMYAYAAPKAGDENAYAPDSREIAYWRKHPNLHGWMEQLWRKKGCPGGVGHINAPTFNGIELELTWEDIANLERDIREGKLPNTTGCFFGSNSDNHYLDQDLEFITEARTQIFLGFKVFYNSSW